MKKTDKPKKNKDKKDNRKSRFLKALAEHQGNISKACEKVKIKSRQTVYTWIEKDPVFAEQFDNVNESQIDHVENKLKERINGVQVRKGTDKDGNDIIYDTPPDTTAIIFYLKTKGQKRGYVEKYINENINNEPLKIEISDKTESAKENIALLEDFVKRHASN